MIKLTMKSDELSKLITDAKGARRDLDDRRKPLTNIRRYQATRWEANFDGKGRIYGRWPAWSPNTVGSTTLLVRTGKMRRNFISANKRGQITRHNIHWQFNDVPAVYHDSGSVNKPWKTYNKQRLLWDTNEQDRAAYRRELEAWADDVMEKHFGA